MIDDKFSVQGWRSVFEKEGITPSTWEEGKPPLIGITGNSFLDDAIQIDNQSFILMGGTVGTGKTQMALEVAKNNARIGRKVTAVFLEAYRGEIHDRRRFQVLVDLYFKDPHRVPGADLRFQRWRNGTSRDFFRDYESQALEILKHEPEFNIVSKTQKFTVDTLAELIEVVKNRRDNLFILDHIHHFDYDSDQETKALTEIIELLHGLVNQNGIPVFLFAQFRKNQMGLKQRKFKTKDDFHGTARLSRVPTDIIVMTRGDEFDSNTKEMETFFDIQKARGATEVTGVVAKMRFSLKHRKVMTSYVVGKIKNDKFESTKRPYWALSAVDPEGQVGAYKSLFD